VPGAEGDTPHLITLGRTLFFDRRLSGDGTMSCSSCHEPERAFTDGLDISLNYPTTKNWRNSPTLMNVGLSRFMFHDGRDLTLEQQALFPIMSAFEMNQNLDYLEEELAEVPGYVRMFGDAFGPGRITRQWVARALAAYQRTLVSRGAPLDAYLSGREDALSPEAKKGLEIFTGKGGCIRCHLGPVLSDQGFHALGVPDNPKVAQDPRIAVTLRFVARVAGYEDFASLREDPGRYLVTKGPSDWKAFKTPTLREVARTGPYMHNGVLETLDDVLDFLDRGGGPGNRELSPLGLTPGEKSALKAFLAEALTGEDIVVEYPRIP
jgi:cytochrome c peroxidase